MNTMIRTQMALPKSQRKAVDQLTSWQNISMAEAYRRAMEEYLQKQQQKQADREIIIKKLAGALKNSSTWKGVDAVAWQKKLRHEKGI